MFRENYAFFFIHFKNMKTHFEKMANHYEQDFLNGRENPFIVEIGSNDGIFLEFFAKKGIHHLGIEPSENVASTATKERHKYNK